MKIYSIKEIVEATNNLLVPKNLNKNNEKTNNDDLKSKKEDSKDILVLKNEITVNNDKNLNLLDHETKIKPEVKDRMVNELYHFLKKKN